jgi:hypothetical protein
MAVTRIKNNQITDSTITFQKIAPGTLVGSVFNANLNLNSNVTITGNLSVSGNTTTVNSIDTTVNDPLIVFNSGYVGVPAYDVGFLADRSLGTLDNYGGVNAALVWSESDGAFITVLTTETGATKGSINRKFQANLITGNLTVSNAATIQTARITNLSVSSIAAVSGNLVAASGTNATNYTTGAIVVPGGGGVGITGDLWVQGPSTFAGNITAGNIQLSGNINVPVGGTFSNTGVFFGNAGGIGALYAGTTTYTALPTTVLQMSGNVDTYAQVNFQNINSGTKASTDFVLTADNGNDTDGFIDLGINSSTYNDANYPGSYANDGYLIHHSGLSTGNLVIFSHTEGSAIKLHVGDYGDANTKATVTNIGFRVNTSTASSSTTSGALIVDGGAGIAGAVYAGSIQNTPIGTSTASSGYFTTLNATNASTGNIVISGGYISALTNAYITTGRTENFSTGNARISGGNIVMITGAGGNTYVTADHVEAFDTNFGNVNTENAYIANIMALNGTITGITNFATSFANIAGGYLDNVAIGANVAGPASFTTANVSSTFNVTNSTESTSSSTGAVQITGGVGIAKNLYVGGNAVVAGNLVVLGTTASVDSIDLIVKDSSVKLHTFANGAPLTTNDGRDIGVLGNYYLGSDKYFFFGQKNSSTYFEYFADATEDSSNVVSGTYGTIKSGGLIISNSTSSTNTITGAVTVAGGVGITGNLNAGTIYAGSINATPIGNATPSTGVFTTLVSTGASTLNSLTVNNQAVIATLNGTANVYLAPQSGAATVTINPLIIGTIDNMSIGATAAANAYVTNQRVSTSINAPTTGPIWLSAGTGTSGIQNIPIGSVTPSTGVFTQANVQGLYATILNSTTANITTLAVTSGLSTGNAVISGGYISALSNATITTGNAASFYATSLNATTANITGAVTFGSFTTANAVISGGFISTVANITVTDIITASTANIGTLVTTGTTTSAGNIVGNSSTTSTSTTTGALVLTGSGGAGIGGNINVGLGATINSTKSAFDTTISGRNENTLLWAHSDSVYDQVVIGGNLTVANTTQGAKLIVKSNDSFIVPVGTSAQRPSGQGYTDVDGMLRFNSTTGILEYYGSGQWNNTGSAFTVITARTFDVSTGNPYGNVDGVNSTFTLAANATTSGTLVTINGVVQIPSSAYSVSGAQLVFTEAPALGDVIDTRVLATTSVVTQLASDNGFNQFVANNTCLSFYTGNVSLGTIENWRIDTNGDFYPITQSNIGAPSNRVDYLFASNINLSGGTISGVALTGGPIDDTPIGGNVGNTGNFTTLTANVFQANTSVTIIAGLMTIDNTANTSIVGGTTGIIDTFDKTVHRSGKFFVQVSDENTGEYQATEVICVHDGTTPQVATYGVTFTGAANLATFSANISGNDVNLNATPVGNVNIKTFATLMKI